MSRNKIVFWSALVLVVSFLSQVPQLDAATKKGKGGKKGAVVSKAAREKKILGWTSDFPTSYAVNDKADFFIRGTVLDFAPVEGTKEKQWQLQVLPIEVLNNPMHYVTLEHFKGGLPLRLNLNRSDLKDLKKGGVVEFNQYSKEIPGETMGHAQLINTEEHREFKAYDTAPVSYLSKTGLEPEQIINAVRGALLYQGEIQKDDALKASVASLTRHKQASLSQEAKKLNDKLFAK